MTKDEYRRVYRRINTRVRPSPLVVTEDGKRIAVHSCVTRLKWLIDREKDPQVRDAMRSALLELTCFVREVREAGPRASNYLYRRLKMSLKGDD